jgi:hypothetical protein
MEVDLLGSVHVIYRAGIEEQARADTVRIIADVFGEKAKLLGQTSQQSE